MKHLLLCLLLLAPAAGLTEDQLGRLFMMPGDRRTLDNLRQIRAASEAGNIQPSLDLTESPTSTLTLQGYVKRCDGRGTAWINHQARTEYSVQGGLKVGRIGDGSIILTLASSGRDATLKAGQSYDPRSGTVKESAMNLHVSGNPAPSARGPASCRP